MFLFLVHLACTNEKTRFTFILKGGMTNKTCAVLQHKSVHLPFFECSKYLVHFWCASKQANYSSLRRLAMIFLDGGVGQNTSRHQLTHNMYPEFDIYFTSYLFGGSLTSTWNKRDLPWVLSPVHIFHRFAVQKFTAARNLSHFIKSLSTFLFY